MCLVSRVDVDSAKREKFEIKFGNNRASLLLLLLFLLTKKRIFVSRAFDSIFLYRSFLRFQFKEVDAKFVDIIEPIVRVYVLL